MTRALLLLLVAAMLTAACGGGADPTPTPAPAAVAPSEAVSDAPAEAPAAGSAQEAIAQVLDVIMYDIYFGEENDNIANPPQWTVTAGSEVTLNEVNNGALEHNWAIVQQGVEIPVPFLEENRDILLYESGVVPGGASASHTFTAPSEPGIYTVICTVVGHYPVMQGQLVVE